MHIGPLITTQLTTMDLATDIELIVHGLKADRDTWQAVALRYKAAFEAHTSHIRKLQDICFATQAELENERAQQHRPHPAPNQMERCGLGDLDCKKKLQPEVSYGTASIYVPRSQPPSDDYINPLFGGVHQCTLQKDYKTALTEIERLLRGPLSAKARTEGLLLKSEILRQTGPSELYDALAACSEALELCDRLSGMEVYLPRIHHQRGIIYYDLRTNCVEQRLFPVDHYASRLEGPYSTRRAGFDENRTIDEELLAKIEVLGTQVLLITCIFCEKDSLTYVETKRRQTSAQLRQRAAATAKRMSLPHRWTAPRG